MTPWITAADVEPLVRTDLADDPWIEALVAHAQGLVEAEIGAQNPDALPAGLTSVLAQIVARLWRAGHAASTNPAGNTQEVLGPHSFTAGNFEAGWGLTEREKDQIGKWRSKLWVQPTERSGALETPPGLVSDAAGGDPIDWVAEADL